MKYIIQLMLVTFLWTGLAQANEIYISQVGDTLNLDIDQDGENNKVGTATQDVVLGSTGNDADTMTFDITQTGDGNTITAQILGNTYTGTWVFTGDNNEVDLLCSSSAAGNCETVTLNITATGDDQDYTINVGQSADADNLVANFTVAGDGAVITTDVNGEGAIVTVNVSNNSSLVNTGNTLDIDIAGDGDANGMKQLIEVNGRGNSVTVNQSGVNDNVVDLDLTGDNGDVDITQTD